MAYDSKEKQKEWYQKNKERVIRNAKNWSKKNTEKRKIIGKKYRENNKELVLELSKKWKEKNPEKVKEMAKRQYLKNSQKSLEYNKLYRERNKEKMKEQRKQRYYNNIEYYRKYNNDRKEKYYLNKYKKIGVDIIELTKAQNNRCAICNQEKKLYVDHCHTKLVVRGLLCHQCNAGIGLFHDNIDSLKNAITYLKLNATA